jgi:hypothetical protein
MYRILRTPGIFDLEIQYCAGTSTYSEIDIGLDAYQTHLGEIRSLPMSGTGLAPAASILMQTGVSKH